MRSDVLLTRLVCGLVFFSNTFAQQIPFIPSGIELLRSTRSDLAKIAKFQKEDILSADFVYNGIKIEAQIAAESCTWHGWNVRNGTILSLSLFPKSPLTINTEALISQGFDHHVVDTLSQYYTNTKSGVQYFVKEDKTLINVRYYPTAANFKSRCVGFPPFNAATEMYSAEDSFKIDRFHRWDMGLLADFSHRISNRNGIKGTVFIYFKKTSFKQARSFQRDLTKYLHSELSLPNDRFNVRLGGLRDENMLEVFLLFTKQPDPTPRPKYSSTMVFAKESAETREKKEGMVPGLRYCDLNRVTASFDHADARGKSY